MGKDKSNSVIGTRKKKAVVFIWVGVILLLLLGVILTNDPNKQSEDIKELMNDAVLHGQNRISLFGLIDVNPAVVSAFMVTAILLVAAALIRITLIPRMKIIPGKFQLVLEQAVGMFDGLAKTNSPHRNSFLGTYIFGAGCYIFFSTIFELFGIQAVSASGVTVALPAPLSDINAAIALGCLSYIIILSGGIASNGWRGVGRTLKDFSLPISMSFRLFGAMLSGLLVTELVYHYLALSFVLPVVVAVLFTLLHALIQTYVLVLLTALFYGEVSEPHIKIPKPKKIKKSKKQTNV